MESMPWKEINVMNQRVEFVMRALKTENFRTLCAEYGISPKTGYKWMERFKEHGLGGLREESRRPRSHARELGEAVICEIVRLKKLRPAWGPKKIRAIYARTHGPVPSESSFKRVLDRAGWVEHRPARKRESAGRLFVGRKASRPNEVWTVDFKGWWYGAPGHRCEPLTVRDEFSRYVLELRALPNAKTETVRACFERLFTEHGLPEAIRSDNGAPFASRVGLWGLTRLSAWWLALGIDLERNRPGCPQDNPAHERLHLDLAREVEGLQVPDQQAFLDQWREQYNCERPHEALAMRTPSEIFQKSDRPYHGLIQDLDYGAMNHRKIMPQGIINWQKQWVFISSALAGWSVGLEPIGQGKHHVWFGRLLLGEFDESALSFTPLTQEKGKEQ
jgi:putative transposase